MRFMDISAYLNLPGVTRKAFAEALGVNPSTVIRWKAGDTIPQRGMLMKIAVVTGGKVRPHDFFAQPSDTEAA